MQITKKINIEMLKVNKKYKKIIIKNFSFFSNC